jgi:hypothetical protein
MKYLDINENNFKVLMNNWIDQFHKTRLSYKETDNHNLRRYVPISAINPITKKIEYLERLIKPQNIFRMRLYYYLTKRNSGLKSINVSLSLTPALMPG